MKVILAVILWDLWIVRQFEKLAHRIEAWIGLDAIILAKLSIGAWIAEFIGSVIATEMDWGNISLYVRMFIICSASFGFAGLWWFSKFIVGGEEMEYRIRRSAMVGCKNPNKIDPHFVLVRITINLNAVLWILLFIFGMIAYGLPKDLSMFPVGFAILCILFTFYFLSCDLLPPGTSKLKKSLNRFHFHFKRKKLAAEAS